MKILSKLLLLLVVIAMLVGTMAACTPTPDDPCTEHVDSDNNAKCDECGADVEPDDPAPCEHRDADDNSKCDKCGLDYVDGTDVTPEFIDYASQVKFNPNSGRAHAEVEVKSYIDGDTTHFIVTDGTKIGDESYIKARYLSINTPESTGVIEAWGKKASNYTKTQLQKATSIIIESDTAGWDLDSTGGRYLLWVWYKTAEDTEYRNLNLEILQQGLAYGSSVSSNVYGEKALAALNQAKTLKLHVFSKDKDPDFYYGGAIELTLKEIKANCEKYEGKLVKFEAVVAKQVGATIYVEEYDAENDMYFGMQIFAGYSYPRMEDFGIGYRVSIVGTLQYYENGGTYQISNLKYKSIDPNWEGGCRVISKGNSASFKELDVGTLLNGSIELDVIEEIEDENGEITEVAGKKTFKWGDLAHYSTATVNNLKVIRTYTTESTTDSDGALTITCVDENGNTIDVRTATQLTRPEGDVNVDVTAADFPAGTYISVKGVIDSFKGEYQIKIFTYDDITFGSN